MIDVSDLYDLAGDMDRGAALVAPKTSQAIATTTRDTERDAKELCAVDKGELRDSIHTVVSGLSGEVIAGTDHAEYVEDGTSVMAPQPFMGPALERNTAPLVTRLEHVAGNIL